MTNTITSPADATLDYCSEGLWLLPVRPYVRPCTHRPVDQSCRECVAYKESKGPLGGLGIKRASNDPVTIAGWWLRWPDARPAVYLKPSGLLVLDWDRYKRDALDGLLRQLPITRTSVSPQGGQHFFFRVPDGFVPPAGQAGELDIKWDGYVILPAPGSGYSWAVEMEPVPWPEDAVVATTLGKAKAVEVGDIPEAVEPKDGPDSPVWQRLDEAAGEDRSVQAYRLVQWLIEGGYTDGEILWLAARHRPSVEKFGKRLPGEVTRMLAKLRDGYDPWFVTRRSRPCKAKGVWW